MNSNVFSFLKSLSVGLPFLIALFRIKSIDRQYIPFVVYLFLSVVSEVCSFVIINFFKASNAEAANFWVLAEWYLVMWQFYRWGLFAKTGKMFLFVTTAGLLAWIGENIVAEKLFMFGPYCRLLYSFVIVIMSINAINYTITHDSRNLFRNSRFIICLCFIIFFSYKIIYEWAYQIMAVQENHIFSTMIISFFGYLNATINLTYVVAVLLIPPMQMPEFAGTPQLNKSRLL